MIQIEDEILTRCRGGDKAAFRWVVQTYQRMLFSLALKMLADEEEERRGAGYVCPSLAGYQKLQSPAALYLMALHNSLTSVSQSHEG